MTIRKPPGKRILSVLLCIMMLLPMLPATALAYVDKIHFTPSGGGNAIEVQGGGCWKNDGTEGSTGSYNIKYDAVSKTLTLNNYNAGSIDTDRRGSSDLTINVNGNNTITGYIEKNAGTLNLAFSAGSTLTINAGNNDEGILINQQSGEPATLDINGGGTLTINTTKSSGTAYGIHASGNSTVSSTVTIENMTVSINCKSSNGSTYGIFAKKVIIDESKVTINASQSASGTGWTSHGIDADSMEIKNCSDVKIYWNSNSTYNSALSGFTPDACTAVNETAGYAHYRRSSAGAGTVTVTGGKVAVEDGIPNRETAQFLTWDNVTLIPNEDLKNYYGFKGWSIGTSSFVGSSFEMPDQREVEVQAYYNVFPQQPQFNYDSQSGESTVTFTYKPAKTGDGGWRYYTPFFYKVNDDGSLTKARVLKNAATQTGTNWKLTETITDTGFYELENGTYRVGIETVNGPVSNFVLYSDAFEVTVPEKLSAPTLSVDGVQLTGTDKIETAPLLNCWQALRIDVTDIPEGAAVMFRVVGATLDSNRFDLPSYGNRSQADNNTTITVTPVSGFTQANIAVQAMKNIKGIAGSEGSVAVWSEPVYVAARFVTEGELPAVTVNVTAEGTQITDTKNTIKFTNSATINATVGTTEPKIWGLELDYSLNDTFPKPFPAEGLTYGSDTYSAFVNVGLISKWDIRKTMGRAQMIHLENKVAPKYPISRDGCKAYNAAGEEITEAAAGEIVTVKATGPNWERFAGWSCVNATVAEEKAQTTTFIMPDKQVDIAAVYFDETVEEKEDRRYHLYPNWLQAAALDTGSIAAGEVISSYEKTKLENPVTITQVWYEGDAAGGKPVKILTADQNYTGIITLSIPAACSFATDFEKSIAVRDYDGNVFPVDVSNIQYTPGDKSMIITLHLVNKPTVALNHYIGQNYSTSSSGSYPAITGHAGYEVTTLNYGSGGTGKITSSASSMTISKLVLTCTDGAYLLPGSEVWVNGTAVAANSAAANGAKTLTTGEFTRSITSPATITAANAIVTPPAAGQRPSFTAISAEPDKYKVELQYWVDDKGGIINRDAINNELKPDYYNYKFTGGDKYQVYVIFTAVAGAGSFAENATYTINGQRASKPSGGSGLLHYCEFIATGEGGGTAPITYSATVGNVDLGTAKVGYKQSDISTRYVAIKNTGTGSLYTNFYSVKLTGEGADNFEIPNSSTPNKIAAGSSASSSWYIKPKEGLSIGTYTATIQFKDKDEMVTATGTVTFKVEDHEFDTGKWESDQTNHWNPCKDTGCTVRGNEAAHNKDVTKNDKSPTFDADGYTGDKCCSVCDRKMETGKAIAAGKYIRESKATMTPAAIHADMCANGIAFTSLEPSKYTVTLKRVYDLTDDSLNTDSKQYPRNKNFIDGHEYRIVFEFTAVSPNVYDQGSADYWSTFTLNGKAAEMPSYATLGGSTDRMIELTASAKPAGVTVRGQVTSYGSAAEAVTVTLTKSGESTPAHTVTISAPGSGSAPFTQGYSFSAVPDGKYTLKVSKANHVTRVYDVTVGSEAVTQDVKICLLGDVNMNGTITSADALQIDQYIAGTREFSDYQIALADVNKKNGVTSADALWVEQRVAGTRDENYNTNV